MLINKEDIPSLDSYIELYSDSKHHIEDFYTDEYKEYMNRYLDEDENMYNKALKKQTVVHKNECEILGLDESASEISHHIDVYYDAYKLPKMSIKSAEWDILFNTIYAEFKKREISTMFHYLVSIFIRSVLAQVLVSKREELSLEVILSYLSVLGDMVAYYTPERFSSEEIDDLKNKILKEANGLHKVVKSRKSKIVSINGFQTKKTLK